jgi:MFS transporter, DHA1 family, inner membrane transport protein
MVTRQVAPTVLLILLAAAVCLSLLSVLMLGPLLVALAQEFHTSVAVVGQLVAATALTWGITALLAGPVADAYGQRRMLLLGLLLMAVGMCGAVLAWTYGALLAFRLLTGVGAAMVPPTCLALVGELFPPTARGKAIGWVFSASGVGVAFGVPLVALVFAVGGWRLPFAVLGVTALGLWSLGWRWLPWQPRPPGQPVAFVAHYREVGAQGTVWYVLGANALQRMVFFGMFAYLAPHLIQSYQLPASDTALPLAIAGSGAIVGGWLGGRVADHRQRLAWYALSCIGSGLLAALVFTTQGSPWATAVLAGGATALTSPSLTVTPTLFMEVAGNSRTTATAFFAVSNQLGAFGGPALGGILLALGGFPLVGLFCLGVSVLAAVVVRLKVRDSAAFLAQHARRKGTTATE